MTPHTGRALPLRIAAMARTCRACAHRQRRGTWAEPVATGLAQWFEIHRPPARFTTGGERPIYELRRLATQQLNEQEN